MLLLRPVGFATLTAATSGSFVGYGDGSTGGLANPEATFGSLNIAVQFVEEQGATTHYICTGSGTLFFWVSDTLTGTSGLSLNVGGDSYAFSAATIAFTGGYTRYSWSSATPLVDGNAYQVSVS